jgi:hypothetical protein
VGRHPARAGRGVERGAPVRRLRPRRGEFGIGAGEAVLAQHRQDQRRQRDRASSPAADFGRPILRATTTFTVARRYETRRGNETRRSEPMPADGGLRASRRKIATRIATRLIRIGWFQAGRGAPALRGSADKIGRSRTW